MFLMMVNAFILTKAEEISCFRSLQ